jgi:hypothetical protein
MSNAVQDFINTQFGDVSERVIRLDCVNTEQAESLLDEQEDGNESQYERVRQQLPHDSNTELYIDRHGLWLRRPVKFLQKYWLLSGLVALVLISITCLSLLLYYTRV